MSDAQQIQLYSWRRWADRCEREGRPVQALLIRNLIFESEHGSQWLDILREHDINPPEVQADA